MPWRDNTFLVEPQSFRHLISQLALLLSWHCFTLCCGEVEGDEDDDPEGAEAPLENIPCQVEEVDSGVEDEVVVGEEEVV